ncbi:MAG: TonB-dependent receptor, partial [Verrucomicrobia bacterium]|nr:TonB-dependent receptor [Verrucomicrobiota bacterium]
MLSPSSLASSLANRPTQARARSAPGHPSPAAPNPPPIRPPPRHPVGASQAFPMPPPPPSRSIQPVRSHFPVFPVSAFCGLPFAAIPALAALLAPLAPAQTSPAPTASVTGRIQNVVTGQYLPNARLTVRGTGQVAFTDDSGFYRLDQLSAGPLVLEVFYTGLDPQEVRLELAPGATLTRDLALTSVARYGETRDTVKLDSFIVTTSRDTEGEALATNEQRFAPNLKAVISTDSFGDMAEGNVGEFLKYLPGITGDHDDAQINTVSLRGFSTNLTVVLADGAQLANANFNGNSRTFQFSQLAINNVSRIEVAKVPTSATPADSMAGSVNLVSKSAFERSRAEFRYRLYAAGNGDYLTLAKQPHSYERRQRRVMPGVDLDYTLPVNRNFGLVLTGSRSLSAGEEDHSTLTYNAAGTATGASISRPYFQQYGINDGSKDITRNSISLKADWRPTPNSVLSLNAMLNQYDASWGHQSMDFNAGTNGNPTLAVAAGGIPLTFGDNFTQGATGRGAVTLGSGNMMTRYEEVRAAGLRYRFDNGTWRLDASLTRSSSTNAFRSTTEGNFAGANVTLVPVVRLVFLEIDEIQPHTIRAFDNSGRDVDLYDINNYRLNNATALSRDVTEDMRAADLNVRRRLGFFSFPFSVQTGGLLRRQVRDSYKESATYTHNGVGGNLSAAPYRNQIYVGRNSHFGLPGQVAPWISRHRAWQAWQQNPALFTMTPAQTVAAEQFHITNSEFIQETVGAAYAQFEARLFRNRLGLLSGVRWEKTTDEGLGPVYEPANVFVRNADGTFARDARGQRIRRAEAGAAGSLEELRLTREERGYRAHRSYDGFYPSLHLTYHVTENFQARAAYARTYGRPDFSEIIPNSTISERDLDETQLGDPNAIRGTIDIRNSGLKPWTAHNYDLSLEYYTAQGGLFSAGFFRKEIADFFANNVRLATAGDLEELGVDPQYVGWQLSTKFNSGRARVSGAEFNLRHPLRPLGAWGRYFTVFANATKLELRGDRQAD